MVLGLLAVAIVIGITIGWSLVQYFAFSLPIGDRPNVDESSVRGR